MVEQLVPGEYTSLVDLIIRKQMDTQSTTNQAGIYTRNLPFVVFEVYPEKNGIVWGRVSSNTGSGESRYVGLRVANNLKAHLEKAFETKPVGDALANAIVLLANAVTALTIEIRMQAK